MNFNKVVIILRAVAGAGKSTVADYLSKSINPKAIVCCADDHFTDKNGNYNFNPNELYLAHARCQDKFIAALQVDTNLVIVANTNVKPSQFDFYIDAAKEFGYTLFSLVVEKRFEGGDNGHNVPEKSLQLMENNIKISLKLR